MTEFILCAANKHKGRVYPGYRHRQCWTMMHLVGIKLEDIQDIRAIQGFLTSHNRWVSRKEAWTIAQANDQIKFGPSTGEGFELISENLYMTPDELKNS